jgi:hypothetical protein
VRLKAFRLSAVRSSGSCVGPGQHTAQALRPEKRKVGGSTPPLPTLLQLDVVEVQWDLRRELCPAKSTPTGPGKSAAPPTTQVSSLSVSTAVRAEPSRCARLAVLLAVRSAAARGKETTPWTQLNQ